MHIAIIATELAPLVDQTDRAHDVAALAAALVATGHEVRVVLPLPIGFAPSAHSLARRLTPILVNVNGQPLDCVRYDGRLTAGFEVHLLELDNLAFEPGLGFAATAGKQAFADAALTLLGSLGSTVDWCICVDAEMAFVPVRQSAQGQGPACLLLVSSLSGEREELAAGLEAAQAIAVVGHGVATMAARESFTVLLELLRAGKASILAMPSPTAPLSTAAAKSTAKATLQLRLALPVRPEHVPLVYFDAMPREWLEPVLAKHLAGNVQAIVRPGASSLASLLERYPDRLAMVPSEEPIDSFLVAADIFVEGKSLRHTAEALACGALPVVGPHTGSVVVELEPSLASGNGTVFASRDALDITAALERATAAYAKTHAFQALAGRLPRYAATWPSTAAHLVDLMNRA